MELYRIDFKVMAWQEPTAGVRCKMHEQAGKKLRLVEFSKDFFEQDWCTQGHVGYILEGELEIDFDGLVISFAPGDGIFIPAGSEHKHKARILTDVVKVILVEDT